LANRCFLYGMTSVGFVWCPPDDNRMYSDWVGGDSCESEVVEPVCQEDEWRCNNGKRESCVDENWIEHLSLGCDGEQIGGLGDQLIDYGDVMECEEVGFYCVSRLLCSAEGGEAVSGFSCGSGLACCQFPDLGEGSGEGGEVGESEMVYFSQRDERWASQPFPGQCSDNPERNQIGTMGCGQTVTAMLLSSYVDPNLDPVSVTNQFYPDSHCGGTTVYQGRDILREQDFTVEECRIGTYHYARLVSEGWKIWVHGLFSDSYRTVAHHSLIVRALGSEVADGIVLNDPLFGPNISCLPRGEHLVCERPGDSGPLDVLIQGAYMIKPPGTI